MDRWVEITFDCLPLRSVGRLEVPEGASPKFQQLCRRIQVALDKHGAYNAYYLHNARCRFHLVNSAERGWLDYEFEGTIHTDDSDERTARLELDVRLSRETCGWLTQPVVTWFEETVRQAVATEFDRYIAAGDLEQTRRRIEQAKAASDDAGGFVGMYL